MIGKTPPSGSSRRLVRLLALVCLPLAACATNSAGANLSQGAPRGSGQSDQDINRIMTRLKPTERFVPNADARLLWQAASGYMERAFPLDELPAAATSGAGGSQQIRTRLVEWVGDGLPHRTRVFVEVRSDPGNAANMRLRVTALLIEGEPQLAQAKQGTPLAYDWRLSGSNPRVEETVADQIMRRYLALREGKPLPLEEEMVLPGRQAGGS
jgi:hypothetical protein